MAEHPTEPIVRSYGRSWVDAVVDLLARAPGPPWVVYAVLTTFFVVGSVVLRWIDGTRPLGDVDVVVTAYSALTFYGPAVIQVLNGTAERALEAFRPALGRLEGQYDELRRGLTTMPPSAANAAIVLGVVVQMIGAGSSPSGWGLGPGNSLFTNVFTIVQEQLLSIFLFAYALRSLRQLRIITRIHRAATNLSLYVGEPHDAFSRFTLAVSVAVTVPYTLGVVLSLVMTGISQFEVVLFIAVLVASAMLFLLPLHGMHRRLVAEKSRLVTESDRRFEHAAKQLHKQLDEGDFEQADGLSKAMGSLVIEGDRLRRISTWPWRAETIRGLLSSIALPVVLWLITTLLARLLTADGR